MLNGVVLRIFHVMAFAPRNWIAGGTSAAKYAMRASARHAGRGECTNANVERWRKRGSAMRGILDVRFLVRSCLGVGSIFVKKGAIRRSVGNAHFRGGESAHVGRGFIKGWLVMWLCHCAGQLVIRC